MPAPAIDLTHHGVSPTAWQPVLDALPQWRLDVRRHQRVVVVAPHPDDETLGVGGLIADAAAAGADIAILSLTNGEAAFDEVGLGERRHAELQAAMSCLVPGGSFSITRLGLPDGGLVDHRDQIAAALDALVRPGDAVFAPLYCDGHPDHDAAGRAAASIEHDDVELCFYPIWAWHWHEPSASVIGVGGRRALMSPAAASAKAAAMDCHVSQTTGDAPILPAHFRGRFDSPFEVVIPAR